MNRPDASSSPGVAAPAAAPPADPSLLDAAEVARSLGVDPASGLSSSEAAERLANVGPNRLDPAAQVPAWRKLLAQFADPLIYLLLAAIVISVVAWALEGAQGVPFEAIVIAVIVVANAVLGFVQERKAEQAAAALLGDRTNMVFSGTAVTRGRGRAVVTATGMATEMGRIAALLGRTQEERTPLQREVDLVGRTLGLAVIAIAVVVVAAILVTSDIQDAGDLVQVLLLGVSLAVAAVPEGLPAVLSVVL